MTGGRAGGWFDVILAADMAVGVPPLLGGLVLVLAAAAVPLARMAHQSLNASTASAPVWVSVPFAVVGFVVAWRKPGNPLGWIILGGWPSSCSARTPVTTR
jgi:hypothetical protein